MNDENIICFAKDWSEDPTSNNHVMELLARQHRVIWLNSIAMRRPDFSSGRDLGKLLSKFTRFLQGAQQVRPNLWVVTPLVLPFPHHRLAVNLNRWILRATVRWLRWRLGIRSFQLWTFLPNAVDYVGRLGESLVVYYCIDDWSGFSYLDGEKMIALERELLTRADVCFCTSRSLVEAKKPLNPRTYLASHGVEYEHFARALAPETTVPDDLARLPRPVIGFFGVIQEWLDLDLLARLARAHPDWSLVLIGKTAVDVTALKPFPNIHFLGRRPYETLPAYCKGFDVAIIPFAVNEMTRHVNPIKLREYLSAGLPVVSTDLPEVACYQPLVSVAQSPNAFVQLVEKALREDSRERRRERSRQMQSETWEHKVAQLWDRVMEAARAKTPNQPPR